MGRRGAGEWYLINTCGGVLYGTNPRKSCAWPPFPLCRLPRPYPLAEICRTDEDR